MEADRELDAEVARLVMELPGVGYYKRESCRNTKWVPCAADGFTEDYPEWRASRSWWPENWDGPRGIPQFTSDPAADYSVLVKVRETWDGVSRCDFCFQLTKLLAERVGFDRQADRILAYAPGDYSRAALAVLKGKGDG